MAKSKGPSMKTLATILVLFVAAGVTFMPNGIYDRFMTPAGTQAGLVTPTTIAGQGSNVVSTCEGSATPTVTLSITNELTGATEAAADTQWFTSPDGITWTRGELDSNSATPSLSVSPGTYWKAQVKDDSTLYGDAVGVSGHVICSNIVNYPVKVKTIDTAPNVILKNFASGVTYSATQNDTMTANATIQPTMRLYTATNKWYNKPVVCFNYDTGNFTSQKVKTGTLANVPYFLKGTVEECYSIPSFGSTVVDVPLEITFGATQMANTATQLSSTVYLVDTQAFITNADVFTDGQNLVDNPYTNVGDSTDASVAGTMYFGI